MLTRMIPLRAVDEGATASLHARAAPAIHPMPPSAGDDGVPVDRHGRALRELRISVIDQCNFRCGYCMPKAAYRDHAFLPRDRLLDFDAIERAARAFVALGVRKIRLTGGEPPLRQGVVDLVARLAGLRTPDDKPVDLAMTTNGSLLVRRAAALRQAGLARLTVSLDALTDTAFRRMNDVDVPVGRVLDGLEAARAAGFGPIKINMVVRRGVNDDEIEPLAQWVRERHGAAAVLRFIEYMDVGTCNRWRRDEVVPADEIVRRIAARFPLEPAPLEPTGTARRWIYRDGRGEIGVVASVSAPFCGGCRRARLSADGRLHTCLFASDGHDLRPFLAEAPDDDALRRTIRAVWQGRDDRYSEQRATAPPPGPAPARRIEMHYIGG